MTIWTAPFADGWNAEQNSRGRIACGGGGTPTEPPTVRLVSSDGGGFVIAAGRFVGWLTDDMLLYLPLDKPGELWAWSVAHGTTWQTDTNAGGNTVRAADGHWLSVTVFSDATGYVRYDSRALYAGALYDGGAVAGARAIHVVPGGQDGAPHVQEYIDAVPARLVRLPENGNGLTLHADGWIGAGHFGETWLLAPGSTDWVRVTVTPWALEGPPTVVLDPSGVPWAWTATASPAGRYMVLGRPVGLPDCIIVEGLPCAWLRVRIFNGQWSIIAVDGSGQLRVATVPLEAPRQAVSWEPPAPDPVPPQPLPPVPPFPKPPKPPAPKPPVPPVPTPPVEEPRLMVYSNRPLFRDPSGWLPGTLTTVDGGVVISDPDGNVLSVQPDGSYQTRPAGTVGPYEVAERAGPDLIFRPGGQIHVVATRG